MAMDKSAADAYVYSKASGMLASSYVGRRALRLFNARSLQELWSLVFKSEMPVVPETVLVKILQKDAGAKFVSDYIKLLSNYESPADILISLLHFYDYDNIKEIGAALCFSERTMPDIVNISPFNFVKYSEWPDIKTMTADSPVQWYDKIPLICEQQANDYRLDGQYVREIWNSCHALKSSCRDEVLRLITEKFKIDNVLWALRLRLYYDMEQEDVVQYLAYTTDERRTNDIIVSDAIATLKWSTDDWDSWRKWKYAWLLNPHEDGVVWNVDPKWIYNAYKKLYVKKAYTLFHKYPFTECPLICYFIIKRNELDNIRTASESLRLNIPAADAIAYAGITEVKK